MRAWFRALRAYFLQFSFLALLGIACLVWTIVAIPLNWILPRHVGRTLGRSAATYWFRTYLWMLQVCGFAHFDLKAIDSLRDAGPLVLAVNHPGLLDALMVLSRLPNVACVIKGSLIRNPLWGAGARLAGYIRNDWFIGSINLAVTELESGSQLLMFPEGTRTRQNSVEDFQSGVAYISYRSGVPIQTLFIEQDSQFLGKDYPILTCPKLPLHFRIRLGARFDSPQDPKKFTQELREYFIKELSVKHE